MTLKTNKIHLFRSMERAEAYAKRLAQAGIFYGHKCTTPVNFVKDLARTAGCDHEIISDSERLAHLLSVVSSTDEIGAADYFYKTQNLELLVRFLKQVSGSNEFLSGLKAVKQDDDAFSFLEGSTILVADEYQDVIEAFGLSEFGVIAFFVGDEFENVYEVEYVDECDVPVAVKCCIEDVAKNSSETTFYVHEIDDDVYDSKNFTFATLSETRAKNAVFVDVLKNLKCENKVGIVSNDVEEDAKTLERLSVQLNTKVKIKHVQKKCFLDTSFGQALYACDEALHGDPKSVETKFSDFMHNPLSGVSLYNCLELEKGLRANPNVARQRVADELKDISPTFDLFMTIADDPFTVDKTALLDALVAHIEGGLSLNDAHKRENLAALEAFREFAKTLCLVGYDDELDMRVLRCVNVVSNCAVGNQKATSEIVLLEPSTLNKLASEQFDTVVFCDVTSEVFNASTSFDALRSLMHKMGIIETFSTSQVARMNFECGIEASKTNVLLCLPERDLRSGSELTPSFVLQELFLRKWGEPLDFENFHAQCERLNIQHEVYGEDNIALIGNACMTKSEVSRNVYPLDFQLSACKNIENYLKTTAGGKVILSPSEIETYCQCPHKWFFERRISPNALDYEFNQIEKGNIIHLAFKLFYDELYSQGIFRLKDLEEAESQHELFGECYNKAVRQILSVGNPDGNEVAKVDDFLNAFDIMQSLNDCLSCLGVQSLMPKGYIVAESEMRIEPEQNVEYAGVVINGTLDRLDVSPETDSFYVLDYKGSLKGHGSGKDAKALLSSQPEDVCLPEKIQALIYASCASKMIDKKCVAAIYMSYNKVNFETPPVVGAIDTAVIDEFYDVVGMSEDSTVDVGMQEYLSLTEQRVKMRLENLLNGDVYPQPLSAKACQFCSVLNCPMRGGC